MNEMNYLQTIAIMLISNEGKKKGGVLCDLALEVKDYLFCGNDKAT